MLSFKTNRNIVIFESGKESVYQFGIAGGYQRILSDILIIE